MKIVFMGTPEFASVSLKKLIEDGHEIVLAVTQPDREKGRGKKIQASPVKELAVAEGIPVFQLARIKDAEAVEELKKYDADIFVVAAFGQILSRDVLDIPKYGCINVHASLLPRYRGASPIQWAILDGEEITGVSIMQMDEGLDTGDVLGSSAVSITADDTGASLHEKLAEEGSALLLKVLKQIEDGTVVRTPQSDEDSCYAGLIRKDMGRLDFTKSARQLDRMIRAFNPWPGAYTTLNGRILKIWNAEPVEAHEVASQDRSSACGTIIAVAPDSFDILTGDGALRVFQLQSEGKKRMCTADFLRGYKLEKNTVCI
ncbi:MAG: methionyl-tRNA formyltransferase [Lachnospiraceae bacterium]|nr:methionyl-tRNA formyltransferase [Lachnospiraceae bacterium]